MAHVCCSDYMVYVGSLLYACGGDVMDVVFYVCIVRRGAVCARVWEA